MKKSFPKLKVSFEDPTNAYTSDTGIMETFNKSV